MGTTFENESVITHVLTIRERLEKMRNIVKENLNKYRRKLMAREHGTRH